MLQRLKRFGLKYRRRGQALVLYALLIPVFLIFAGAWQFPEDEDVLSDYSYAWLIDFVPQYILKDPDTGEAVLSTRETVTGDNVAKAYVKKNLAPEDSEWSDNNIVDAHEKKYLVLRQQPLRQRTRP